jgi:hypothetical protein
MLENNLKGGLGGTPNAALQYTDQEEYILQILAVTFASVSIASSILTAYWFINMRRAFRHKYASAVSIMDIN